LYGVCAPETYSKSQFSRLHASSRRAFLDGFGWREPGTNIKINILREIGATRADVAEDVPATFLDGRTGPDWQFRRGKVNVLVNGENGTH
jgi:hypothetical protein